MTNHRNLHSACALGVLLTSGLAAGQTTGIWYSTWYTAKEPYIWLSGFGKGSTNQFIADITGDGMDDAIVYSDGAWHGSNSNGVQFNYSGLWIAGHGIGSSAQLMGDVTGGSDLRRSDAVVFFGSTGDWYVAASNASSFDYLGQWAANFGNNSSHQFLADTDGDPQRRADAVAYYAGSGFWVIARSSGTSFTDVRGCTPFGAPSGPTTTFLVDANNDSKADIVQRANETGFWWVALSNGYCFDAFRQWSFSRFGQNRTQAPSDVQLVGEVNGAPADAVEFFGQGPSAGQWWIGYGNNGKFDSPAEPSAAKHGFIGSPLPNFHGHTGSEASRVFLGKVTGGGARPVVFTEADGTWRVLNWLLFSTPDQQHFWQANNIHYKPLTPSGYRPYDSADPLQIDLHLEMMRQSSIDFAIFDTTNNNFAGGPDFIARNAIATGERFKTARAIASDYPGYAVAVGRIQFDHAPASIEIEAGEVLRLFDTEHSSYFRVEGKPLLVVHAHRREVDSWNNWRQSHPTPNASKFSIRWSQGPHTNNPTTNSLAGIASEEWQFYYGWVNYQGTQIASCSASPCAPVEGVVVGPGYNNRRDGADDHLYHDRWHGAWYHAGGWSRIQDAGNGRVAVVVIASLNEYLEESAIWPAETQDVPCNPVSCEDQPTKSPRSEPWQSAFQYWSATCLWNRAWFKGQSTSGCPSP